MTQNPHLHYPEDPNCFNKNKVVYVQDRNPNNNDF